ncbi:hypothetical protein EDD11_005597 [Mortierella claussenii]|nr:hypothetical protein EDD11_005597 [Mortierella claussenii]
MEALAVMYRSLTHAFIASTLAGSDNDNNSDNDDDGDNNDGSNPKDSDNRSTAAEYAGVKSRNPYLPFKPYESLPPHPKLDTGAFEQQENSPTSVQSPPTRTTVASARFKLPTVAKSHITPSLQVEVAPNSEEEAELESTMLTSKSASKPAAATVSSNKNPCQPEPGSSTVDKSQRQIRYNEGESSSAPIRIHSIGALAF